MAVVERAMSSGSLGGSTAKSRGSDIFNGTLKAKYIEESG